MLRELLEIDSPDFLMGDFYIKEPTAEKEKIEFGLKPTPERPMIDTNAFFRLKMKVITYINEIIAEVNLLSEDHAMTVNDQSTQETNGLYKIVKYIEQQMQQAGAGFIQRHIDDGITTLECNFKSVLSMTEREKISNTLKNYRGFVSHDFEGREDKTIVRVNILTKRLWDFLKVDLRDLVTPTVRRNLKPEFISDQEYLLKRVDALSKNGIVTVADLLEVDEVKFIKIYGPKAGKIIYAELMESVENLKPANDSAMTVTKTPLSASLENPGGIDLNPANLDLTIKRDGKGVPLPLALQDMSQLSRIQGFEPEIIEIKPAMNLPILNELRQEFQSLPVPAGTK
jgi:hypothetical protein